MKKHLFHKLFALLLILALTVTVFAGCGSSDKQGTSEDGTKTTEPKSSDNDKGDDSEEKVLKWVGTTGYQANGVADKIIERFKEVEPEIKVEYMALSSLINEEFFQKYDTMIAAGDQIDLVYLQVTDILNRAMNEAILPINDYIKEKGHEFEKDYGTAASILTVDGNVYGVPQNYNAFRVFYNKTWLEEKGVTIPENWTWDDFHAIAKKMADPDAGIYGSFIPLNWQELTFAGAEQAGWKMIVEEDGKVKPNFDDEKFKKYAEFLYKLSMEEGINPDLATIKAEQLNRRIHLAEKKTPMIVDSWYSLIFLNSYQFDSEAGKPLDFEIGVAELPRFDESTSTDVTYAIPIGAYGIPKTAKYGSEAYALARFICNDNPDLMMGIPAYEKGNVEDSISTYTDYTDKKGNTHTGVYPEDVVRRTITLSKKGHFAYYDSDPLLYAKYQTVVTQLYYQQYELYYTGQQTLEEFVENMQKRAEQEIAKIK